MAASLFYSSRRLHNAGVACLGRSLDPTTVTEDRKGSFAGRIVCIVTVFSTSSTSKERQKPCILLNVDRRVDVHAFRMSIEDRSL